MGQMSTKLTSLLVIVAAYGGALLAQTGQPARGQRGELATFEILQRKYNGIKSSLIKLAEKMPDAEFGFRPTPETRTFGAGVAHVARMNFEICASLVRKPDPHKGATLESSVTRKPDAVRLLQDSFAFCDGYMGRLSRAAMTETVAATSPGAEGPVTTDIELGGLAIDLVTHEAEMYGYLAVYLRLKGIVPPTSDSGRGERPSFAALGLRRK